MRPHHLGIAEYTMAHDSSGTFRKNLLEVRTLSRQKQKKPFGYNVSDISGSRFSCLLLGLGEVIIIEWFLSN